MITINLLPTEKKEQGKILKRNLGFLIFCLSILVIFAILTVVLIAVNHTIKSNLDGLKNNIETSTNSLRSFNEIKDQTLFINDRLKELSSSTAQRDTWWNNLQSLAQATPSDIQLTDFVINTTDKTRPEIKITGLANSQQQIILMKDQLEVLPLYKNVIYDSSRKITVDDKEYIEFNLFASFEEVQ